jgi:hypothetical protein
MVLVGITGLAVDITNGLRNKTMLQATADSAALAGVIDLPNSTTEVVANAIAYSDANMPVGLYGNVLNVEDVEIGAWNAATHSFIPGGVVANALNAGSTTLMPDAVRVTLHQTEENGNAVPVSFLRIVGLQTWDVNVRAVAQRFLPDCLTDGLVARGIVDISSNNDFVNRFCIHGQKGVHQQNNNYHGSGVIVSMPDVDDMLVIPTGGLDSNPGLRSALREQSLDPRMVNHIDEILTAILALDPSVVPSYIDLGGGDDSGDGGGCVGFFCGGGGTPLSVIVKDEKWNFSDAAPGNVYHIECAANKNVGIPSGKELQRMVIISDCQLSIGAGAILSDVVLASRAGGNPGGGGGETCDTGDGNGKGKGGNKGGGDTCTDTSSSGNGKKNSGSGGPGVENANINGASGVVLGTPDNCAPGGGVQIFTNASVHFSSTTSYNGVQIVAVGDVDLGARDMGINGINVQAGGDITLTSNNGFGVCATGAPNLQTMAYFRLVQ